MDSSDCIIKSEITYDENTDISDENNSKHDKNDQVLSELLLLCTPDIDTSNIESSDVVSSDSNTVSASIRKSRLLGFGLAPVAKRRHKVLSLEEKLELLRRLENGESVTSLSKTYNIGRTTISDIKGKKERILAFAAKLKNDDELKTRKTMRKKRAKSKAAKSENDEESEAGSKNEESLSESKSDSVTSDSKAEVPVPDTSSRKRKHNVLTMDTKIEIIQRLEKGESAVRLAPIYNIGRTTISDIKRNKDSILMFAAKLKSDESLKKRKRIRKPNDSNLENAVYMWYIQKIQKGEFVNGPLLCEKALELNKKLGGPPDFKASNGWLHNFRTRHGIKYNQNEKESSTVDILEAGNVLQSYYDLMQQEGYTKDDIYTADETEIDWQTMPVNSLVYQRLSSERQENPDRVTIMMCANSTWNHPLPLVMIGKRKRTKCFGKISCLPLKYKWQKNGWMDSEIFMDWYANEFIPQVKKERERTGRYGKVLLFLDSASYYPLADMLNIVDENFSVMFLPANVTLFAHPMDQSIVRKLKRMLKKQILRRLLIATDDEESMFNFAEKFTLKECCYMLADAWDLLSQENMQSNLKMLWGKPEESKLTCPQEEENDLKEFVELFKALPGFSNCTLENARQWLHIDSSDPADQILSEDEIITSVKDNIIENEENSDVEDGYEGSDDINYPTHSEAFNAFDVAMEWCEQQKDCSPEQLLLLKRLKDLAARKIWIACDESKLNE